MKTEQICMQNMVGDEPIVPDDLPCRADLSPVGQCDELYPRDELECEAYWDFIHWVLEQDFVILKSIPMKNAETDFWQIPLSELNRPGSAFNTVDFLREHSFEFDRAGYRLAKILERALDLALRHSCLTRAEGRLHVYQKFVSLVEREFRERARVVAEAIEKGDSLYDRQRLSKELGRLNDGIRACNKIWTKYADWPDGLSASTSDDSNAAASVCARAVNGGGYA